MSERDDLANVLRLYEELGVRPDDGVERLTARYRARVRDLHPDQRRAGRSAASEDSGAELAWMTRSYREAVAFHRRHGRLPGATLRGGEPRAQGGPLPVAPTARAARPQRVRRASRPVPSRWRWPLTVAAIASMAAIVTWEAPQSWRPPPQGTAGPGGAGGDADEVRRALPPQGTIRVGATRAEVLRIQGPPESRDGARWHYGVSWIDFENERVVDWYSARARPLRVERARGR